MQLFFRFGTVLAAWFGSIISMVPVLLLGLVVAEWVIFPLGLAISGLLAALSAGWAGTLLARDQTQTQLWPVIWITEAVAIGLAVIFLLLARLGVASFGPLIFPVLIFSLILALCAGVATWRFRSPKQDARSELKLTMALLVLAVVSVPAVVFIASLFGLTGA